MGTNFYTRDGLHIGKRSAAGTYCWDCRLTLCKGGEKAVHMSTHGAHGFYDACPKCGAAGEDYVSSFSWAINPSDVPFFLEDEYGRPWTRDDFWEMLRLNSPIRFHDSIGREFC